MLRTRPVLAFVLVVTAVAWLPDTVVAEKARKPGKVHSLKSRKHDRAFSLYVPSKYSKKSSWPLVISSHGRGGSGEKEIRSWQALANNHGFIVACPNMVTATNHYETSSNLPAWKEDDEVLLSIYEEICETYNVNRRAVMITGFSGGGNPSYHSGLGHPEVFTHICTRGGNFAPQQIPTDARVLSAGRKKLQIYIFFGERDHVLIIGDDGESGQAHQARDALAGAGYENVKFEKIAGMKHQSRPDIAAEWFGAYLKANKKRFKAGDKADKMLAKARAAIEDEKYGAAVKELLKCRALETKEGLESLAQPQLDALDEIGRKRIEEAKAAREAGDVKAADKLLASVARDFKGLPSGEAAKSLQAAWRQ